MISEIQTEFATFLIGSSDISTSETYAQYPVSNSVGSINQNRTLTTWNNISMKNMLGDLYDKYKKFGLRLNAVNYVNSTYGANDVDKLMMIKLKGLPFLNNTYEVSSNGNKNSDYTIMSCMYIASGASGTILFPSHTNVSVFERCENVNLQIELTRVGGQAIDAGVNQMVPRFTYFFSIFGIE